MKKKSIEYKLRAEKRDFSIEKIKKAEDAYNYAKKFYFDDINIYESVFVILLNQASNTIGYAKISQGGISMSVVDVRIIAKYAIESLASGVILVHNHPSGNKTPSMIDNNLTSKVKQALEFLDIRLIDHIVITENSYYSYQEEGRL